MFEILARLFGRPCEPEFDPSTLSRFRQLRERSATEELADGKRRDLLSRMRGSELQTAIIRRWRCASSAEQAVRSASASKDATELADRDLTGRKGF